jgi:hypothetical protein
MSRNDGRPAFIGPRTEWVECWICGQVIEDMSRVEGIDVSADDEYYPRMKPVCPKHVDGDDVDRGDRVATDGGFEELNALERQADALEEIAEQQRIQNAALLELIRTLDHRLPELHDHPPAEPTSPRSGQSLAGWVEDAALDLDERVDLDAVARVSEGSQ